jgi:RND family efflux transporter MFP subunit
MHRALALLAAALALTACTKSKSQAPPPPPPAVEAATVSSASTRQELSATGALERQREFALAFRVPGVMTALSVDEGDAVRAGQIVARLDPTTVEAARERALVEAERARRDLARDRTLFEKGYVSRQRLDDRQSAVRAAEASLASAAFDRRWAQLTAPASGVILRRLAQSGEVVQAGQAVLRMADETSPLVLRAPLSDREVGQVKVGDAAMIRLDALPGQALSGRVARIGQAAGALTGAVEVEIELPSRPDLRSGQIATARIAVRAAAAPGFDRVPAEAILEARGREAFVLTIDAQSKARRQAVTFGGFDGDDALVSGLPPGARVITAGAGFINEGETVRVIDPASLGSANLAPAKGAAR